MLDNVENRPLLRAQNRIHVPYFVHMIFEPLANFPSEDDEVDARRMNEFLESQIVRFPEQYYWVHRRFKHRPEGVPAVY